MSFLGELRKRKVFQVAAGYLAVAWLLVQVTATILPAFDMPMWTLRLVVLLFALGFPLAILMAWALQLTPQGLKLDVSRSGGKAILAVSGVLVALALGWYFRSQALPARAGDPPGTEAAVAVADRSVAVLPLVNASNDPEQQFFSDGLSENLIASLSRLDGLRVIGRISAFQFRDSRDDSAAIGRKLGAAYLLNGSVQRAGGLVRISASLVKARDGSTLWAEHYDRPYKDLFALQDEIAKAVAGALHARLLSPDGRRQDDRPPGGSIDAYNAYLQGLTYWHAEEFVRAADYLTRAVELDPAYAVAWALQSGSLSTVAAFGNEPRPAAAAHMRQARRAADRALELAPELGAAHAARAYLHFYEFDHAVALSECRRAVELAPEDGTVLNGCAYTFAGIGRLGEAILLRERLLSIEPLYTVNYVQYAELLMATGRLDDAAKYLATGEASGGKPQAYRRMMLALLRGDADAAAAAVAQGSPKERPLLAAMAAQLGPDRGIADRALATYVAGLDACTDCTPYDVAVLHALNGDAAGMVQWLERAWTRQPGNALFVLSDPFLLRYRDDPRFIAFCRKVGLAPPGGSDALGMDRIRRAAGR